MKQLNTLSMLLLIGLFVGSCFSTKSISKKKNESTFDSAQIKMIADGDSTQKMRVFKITSFQDSILLRMKSEKVEFIEGDPFLGAFAQRMYATVTDSASAGVGIAAPQVGILKSMIWVQRFDKANFPFECYINPVIKSYSEEKIPCPEGCLSIPDKQAMTQIRAKVIEIEYDKLDGTHHVETVEGFTSVVFQHEIDHLHGILFIDHLEEESN